MCIFTGALILSADIDWVHLFVEEDAEQSENLAFSDSCGKEGWESIHEGYDIRDNL